MIDALAASRFVSSMPEFIHIVANGAGYELAPGTSLPDFIREQGLDPKQVVTERNGRPVTASEALSTVLSDGDTLELVRIVAGG